jgi:hypothetical protein
VECGNPPGKKGSLGDAINWETLLLSAPDDNIYFISDDKDYQSPINSDNINRYLYDEWHNIKESKVTYYKSLSSYFRDEYPHIELASELEKDLLIRDLTMSHNFANTHSVISKLRKYSDYTDTQINQIVEAYITNSQINWIINDGDVSDFIKYVISDNEDRIDEDNLHRLNKLLEEGDDEVEVDDLDF